MAPSPRAGHDLERPGPAGRFLIGGKILDSFGIRMAGIIEKVSDLDDGQTMADIATTFHEAGIRDIDELRVALAAKKNLASICSAEGTTI